MSKFTALFKNTRILKFKSQLTIPLFAAVNHLNGPLRKLKFTSMGSKGLWFVICDCWISIRFACFFVSRFATCNRNYDWRERKTLWRRLLNFRVRVFLKSVVSRTNKSGTKLLLYCLPPRARTLFFRTEASAKLKYITVHKALGTAGRRGEARLARFLLPAFVCPHRERKRRLGKRQTFLWRKLKGNKVTCYKLTFA